MKNANLVVLDETESRAIEGGVDPITAIGVVFGLAITAAKAGYDLGKELYRATHPSQYKD